LATQICSNKGAGTFWGHLRGKNREKRDKIFKKNSDDIWHGSSSSGQKIFGGKNK